MEKVEVRIINDIDLCLFLQEFAPLLLEARLKRSLLYIDLCVGKDAPKGTLGSVINLLEFTEGGRLIHYEREEDEMDILKRDIIDEEIFIKKKTILIGDIFQGAKVIIFDELIHLGENFGELRKYGSRASYQPYSKRG